MLLLRWVFLALPLIPICLTFFAGLFLIILAATFFREEAFFRVFFFARAVLKVGVFKIFFIAWAVLAEEAGALVEVFFATFLIPGFDVVEAFLAPALAAFLEAADFAGAMLLTSDLHRSRFATDL